MVPIVPCPVLIGRAAEVEILSAALDAARAGHGTFVFVVGEAGIGKSRLVHELSSMAAGRGALVLRGRAVPGSISMAFRPLAEALGAVVPEMVPGDNDLEPWLPALAAVVPTVGSPAGTADATAPVRGEAVLRLLRSACAGGGGLLVLEDLHWADPETVAILEHLSDNIERAPVLCVATARSETGTAAWDLVRRVAARRTARVLELGRLNDAQVAAMVHSCTDGGDTEAVARVVPLADGVPFLVEEMLVSPGLPASFADTVAARLAEFEETDRRVLITAAAYGRDFDWRLLSTATELSDTDVIDALDRGVAAQLLAVDGDGFRFRHALTAEAVFQTVIPPRRIQFACAALAALDAAEGDLPGDLRDVAARLAERAGQTERAGRLHLASGEEALRRGALNTAVVALERSTELLPAGDDRDVAGERLVEALTQAGRVEAALTIGADLVDRLPAERAAAVHLNLAAAAITAWRWDVAGSELGAVRQVLDTTASPVLEAELAAREAELALGTNDTARAEERARHALELARREGVAEVECLALQLLGRGARRSSLEVADVWFRRALAVAEAHGLAVWRLRALHEIGTIALLDRSDVAELLDAQALAESMGAMATAAILDIEIAAGFAGLDDLEGIERHGRRAVQRATELGFDVVAAYGWLHLSGAAAFRGDLGQAKEAAAAARAAAPGNRDVDGLVVGASEVFPALLAADDERALAAAARFNDLVRGSVTVPPAHSRTAWPLLLAVTNRPEAAAAVEELEQAGLRVSGACRGWLTLARAVIAGRTDRDRAAALAIEADQDLAPTPVWRSLGRRYAAQAALADGWEYPDEWLVEAEELLRRHGYVAAADACRDLHRDSSATIPPSWARWGVTRREADVLALVIEGCSNREIADRLYLSVRTVEKHVEALLRKSATRTRTQLARVAATT
jgi:DNA-binding CsgD family transcriptional regulator